mmetsp:Transcript_17561/g.37603  ORF Transcript_17561/g.37603 Transcript_17561/m.37603 type:complete len:338 (-) Transcript_17561:373-1386(-)
MFSDCKTCLNAPFDDNSKTDDDNKNSNTSFPTTNITTTTTTVAVAGSSSISSSRHGSSASTPAAVPSNNGEDEGPTTVDGFVEAHGLNKESHGVLTSLSPEIQEIVIRQFRPKASEPGSYEVNGKFIMFARSVERGQKGKGKGDKGPPKGKGPGWSPMKGGPCKGGCQDYWGGGWDGGWGPLSWSPDPWSWGSMMGDWGSGWSPWGPDWGKGSGKDYWGKPSAPGWGYKGWDEWGKNGKGWKGDRKGTPYEDLKVEPPSKDEIAAFCTQWQLNEDARAVLDSLDPATTHSVLKEFKGGESGQVNGRFIVFARGVQKGRFPVGKGGKGSSKGVSYSPY